MCLGNRKYSGKELDLSKIKANLDEKGEYKYETLDEFLNDVNSVFDIFKLQVDVS